MPTHDDEAVAVPARRKPGRPRKLIQPVPAPEPVIPAPDEDLSTLDAAAVRALLGGISTWTLRRMILCDENFPEPFSVAGGFRRWLRSDFGRYLRAQADRAAAEKAARMAAKASRSRPA
ncbi:hypothetical protein [Paraburkholderia youngii]|uniref:hypothetical protein n=1 Tax=Paraburkholderia youngii TaxID=2782701 RepID=UPI003D25AAEC